MMRQGISTVILILLYCVRLQSQNPSKVINDSDLGPFLSNWSADTTYLLDGFVYQEANGHLQIEAGTIIKALNSPSNGDPTSALIICNGARISAQGAYMNPIVFTSEADDLLVGDDLSSSDRGLWGGLIILGNAPVINNEGEQIDGAHPLLPEGDPRSHFGGNDSMHSSGVLRNVSIRFAGAQESAGNFSGLTLGAIGVGTKIDSVEVFASDGNGFNFVGGTVDSKNLSSSFCSGDCFKWDLGFVGRGQFWFGLQGPEVYDGAIEGSGLYSHPIIYNATLIGSGRGSVNSSTAIRLVDGSGMQLGMSIITDFPNKGIEVEDLPGTDDSYAKIASGEVAFKSNIWSNFESNLDFSSQGLIMVSPQADEADGASLAEHLRDSNFLENSWIKFISRSPNRLLYPDERPEFPDPRYPLSYPTDTSFFIRDLSFPCFGHGAFMTDGAWWLRYWTALDNDGYLMHPCAYQYYSDSRLTFLGGDTIVIACEMVDQLDFYHGCINSKCFLGNQNLSLAMRRKRKKRNALRFDQSIYCYVQELEYTGEELLVDSETLETTILDTFVWKFTAKIVDTIKPTLSFQACDTCYKQILVTTFDCDTSWIANFDSTLISDSIIQYHWYATDRCQNQSVLTLDWNTRATPKIWYQDVDEDGYGNTLASLSWQGTLPGYVLTPGDCDDGNALVNPAAIPDPNDNIDNNCQGVGSIEICRLSDEVVVSTFCDPVTYMINPSSLEANSSTSFECGQVRSRFDGDVWFSALVPNEGVIEIDISAEFSVWRLSVYSGNCNGLELVSCTDGTSISVEGLSPSEKIMIQVLVDNAASGPMTICVASPQSTAIKNQNYSNQLSIFPNPSSGKYSILKENGLPLTGKLQIYSLFGQHIKSISLYPDPNEKQEIDLTEFPNGIYFVTLQNEHGRWSDQIIKM